MLRCGLRSPVEMENGPYRRFRCPLLLLTGTVGRYVVEYDLRYDNRSMRFLIVWMTGTMDQTAALTF